MTTLTRRLLGMVGLVALLGAGYTAGFILSPPHHPTITRAVTGVTHPAGAFPEPRGQLRCRRPLLGCAHA